MTTNKDIFNGLIELDSLPNPVNNVDSLNGITETAIRFLTLDNGGTKAEMFDKVKVQALEFLESEFIGGLSGYKDFNSVISTTSKVSIPGEPDTYTANGLNYVGCVVQINKTPDKTKLVIKGIDFVCDSAITTNVKIFNLRSGLEVFTQTLTITVGVNEIVINHNLELNFGSGLYFIGFLPTYGAVFTELSKESSNSCIVQKSGLLPITAQIGINNVVEIAPYFNVLCLIEYSYTKIIEDNKNELATAFKYACGFVMLDRICTSKQADRETLINREAQESLANMYREDAIKYIKNARNEIYGKLNAVGSLKPIEKKRQTYSLGSFV